MNKDTLTRLINGDFFRISEELWQNAEQFLPLAHYEISVAEVMTPDCARWLEQGRAAFQ